MKAIKSVINMFEDLIRLYLPTPKNDESAFVFLVHPRDTSDFYRKYPFLVMFPPIIIESVMRFFWPITLSEITGLTSMQDGKPIKGWLISILFTGKMLLKKRNAAKKKILKAIKLAEKKGAKIVGLGALTSSITNGGLELADKTNIKLTNGNSLTTAMTINDIQKIIENPSKRIPSLAIVGATGSIGKAVSISLSGENIERLILVGKTPEHLKALKEKIESTNNQIEIVTSTELKKILEADIIIIATASHNALIKKEHLKNNAIVYDISQPQNVDRNILKSRPDIRIIDGGIVSTPGINYHFNFGLQRETAFACLAETMLLAAEKISNNFSLGNVELKKVEIIKEIAKKYNFTTKSE